MTKTLVWIGDGASRMEVAHVEQIEPMFAASGTPLGVTYELRYRLEPEALHLELVGERTLELGLDGADFFDLGWSPMFNSLPVIRDRLLEPGPARDYRMREAAWAGRSPRDWLNGEWAESRELAHVRGLIGWVGIPPQLHVVNYDKRLAIQLIGYHTEDEIMSAVKSLRQIEPD